jgi:small GTP-binding protein
MAPMYYRGAKAAVLVFDMANEESFHHAISWLKDLKVHADPDVVICLAGNKCDKSIAVDIRKVDEFAASIGAKFVKCSALTGQGVDDVFQNLARGIIDVYSGKSKGSVATNSDTLNLNNNQTAPAQTGCC